MPGIKDTVTIIVNDERCKIQKRLLLLNLKELHAQFQQDNPDNSVGFSTFAKLRPKNCILAGSSGTHSVCVCTIHENCKLMLEFVNIENVTRNWDTLVKNYKDCLSVMICKNPTPQCHLDECDNCPGIDEFCTKLLNSLDEVCISHVQCISWTGTDRSTLQTVNLKNVDFIDELRTKFQKLKPHSFFAKQQSMFTAEIKERVCEGEVLVMFDFSENYAYTVQNASQAFHFNNDQCTVFPAIYYYLENSEIKHKTCVFLSNSLKHDTAAVYSIQVKLIPEIRKSVRNLKKIIYITDGAKQHFKNRFQISNLLHYLEDFGVEAEWHYSATSHGKSGYDGVGATFKRAAYRASLTAKPKDAILTPEALFKWAKSYFKNIETFYISKVEYEKMKRKLNKRFESALPVPEIIKNHAFQVLSVNEIFMKRYSNATEGRRIVLK